MGAMQQCYAFRILSASRQRFLRAGGGELHPTPHYVSERILSSESMLDNFSNHIEQESKNCDGILYEMQNLIFLVL